MEKVLYNSFYEMPVWQDAYSFAIEIYELTGKFPDSEKYSLVQQIRRSAVSISANIAEAYGRFHYKDKINFYYNSRGSLMETMSNLKVAEGLNYITTEIFKNCEQISSNILEGLNKIISSLKK